MGHLQAVEEPMQSRVSSVTAMLTQRSIVGFSDSARLLTCRCSMDFRDSTRSSLISSTSGAQRVEISQSRDVVGNHGQGERLVDFVQPSDHHLSHSTDHLRPSEALLDALPFALTDLVANVSRGPAIDGAACLHEPRVS